MTNAQRDLSAPEVWERSLERSRKRRALAPRLRRETRRRKGVSATVAAATMAGPGTPLAVAQVSGDVQADVAAAASSKRVIEVREGGLPLRIGSQGPLVAHVQKALGVPADGLFGPLTDTAVRRYQARAGLNVDGIVGPFTWTALFERAATGGSNVPPAVKERVERELQEAGARLEAQAGAPAPRELPGSRSPEVPSTRDEAPADGQQPAPPVSTSCGSSTLASPVNGTVTSEYGPRWGRNHDGMDIAAPTGTAIRAAACGAVTIAGVQSGYGNMVCITHNSRFSTCYAHMSRFAVSQGAQVRQGQVIGYVGCTGSCTGPHLHFETRVGGQAQNPRGYLGAKVPGGTASSRAVAAEGAVGGRGEAAMTVRGGATAAVAQWSESSSAEASSESIASSEELTAQTAVGPTTETAAPGEGIVPAPAPVEPAPAEVAPAPIEAVAAPVPVEVAPAPMPVEAAPAPIEAAPAPVPAEVAPAPAPVEAVAPTPAAPAPVEAAPAAPAPTAVVPAEAPAPADTDPAVPAPTGARSGGVTAP